MRASLPFLTLGLLAVLTGCAAERPAEPSGPLDRLITEAASAHGVPRDLMVAIARVEGGLRLAPVRDIDADEVVPIAGVLELRHGRFNSLARGAALSGASELDLQRDLVKGTDAGARVLDDLARDFAVRRDRLDDWAPVVEELSGHLFRAQKVEYRARIFHLLRFGGTAIGRSGEAIIIPPHEEIPIELTIAPPLSQPLGTPEFAGAIWFETPQDNKWAPGRPGPITMIAIHDTEGGWEASVATLQNDPGKSVHYIIDEDGSRVGQFLYEADTGWHVGNSYYNKHMVGIEHVGYSGDDAYQTPMYKKSAELVNSIAKRNKLGPNGDGTGLTRSELVAHQEVPDGGMIPQDSPPCPNSPGTCIKSDNYGGANNHRDPGVNWEWCQYLELIGNGAECKCNDAFEHFNCVHDLSEAVRCPNGVVEFLHCPGGCVGMPIGVDDECGPDPATNAVATTGAGTGGGAGVGGSGAGTGGAGGAPATSGSTSTGGPPGADDQEGGCACRATPASNPWGALGLGAIAALGFAVRRRSRR